MILEKVVKRILPPHLIQAVYYVWYGGRLIGMTSLAEQKFYTECAAMLSGAKGAIVDLGCWMCSTAISLAKGLRQHGEGGRCTASKVYAFDRFVWEAWMDRYLPIVSRNYLPGDSFLPEAQRRIKPYSDLIELVEGDLTTYVWQGGPIKLLLVDAMKSWQLAQAITSSFYPSLREGSVLIHQDFKHYWTPWIHIVQYRLRDYFRLMREVTKGGTVSFETLCEIPANVILSASEFTDVSDEEVDHAMEYSLGMVGDQGKPPVMAAHVMYFVHKGRPEKASKVFAMYRARGIPIQGDFALAEQYLQTGGRG